MISDWYHNTIMDLFQKQTAGRGRGSGLLPVSGRQNYGKLVTAYPTGTDSDQGSCQIAHHMAEKAVPAEAEGKMLRSVGLSDAFGPE